MRINRKTVTRFKLNFSDPSLELLNQACVSIKIPEGIDRVEFTAIDTKNLSIRDLLRIYGSTKIDSVTIDLYDEHNVIFQTYTYNSVSLVFKNTEVSRNSMPTMVYNLELVSV